MRDTIFIRAGKTIREFNEEAKQKHHHQSMVKTYRYFNEAKRASHILTMVYGLGAVRRG